jgi:CHAT domain-containing protein/tetratricopeptide (TPR) repeat protein
MRKVEPRLVCSFVVALVLGVCLWAEALATAPSPPALKEAERLQKMADSLYEAGKYSDAMEPAQRALAIREKTLGPEHRDVAESLNSLALFQLGQGHYSDAEPLAQRALKIRETALGKKHPDVAVSLNTLAWLYWSEGRNSEAQPLLERALEIREKSLGPEHELVAESLDNLAVLLHDRGRYGEAEPLYQRALRIQEKVLGPENTAVAQSLDNLARLYKAQGRYAEVESFFSRALKIREKAQGSDHPDVANCLNSFAVFLDDQGRYGEAEPLYRRALDILEKALGPRHPQVAGCLNNLSMLYQAQGRYANAEPLAQRALMIQEMALGPQHPAVATSLNNLASLYQLEGRYAEAEPLFQRALEIREKVLGPDHPQVASSLNNIALLYQDEGRFADAVQLYAQALKTREKALGKEHPDVAITLNSLAVIYQVRGRYPEAESLFQRALKIRESALGSEHWHVAASLHSLAVLNQAQGRYADAESLFQRAMTLHEKTFGPEHPRVATNLSSLASLYRAQGRYAKAEPLLQRALRIREGVLGPEHPDVAKSLNQFSFLYQATGRPRDALTSRSRGLRIEQSNLERVFAVSSEPVMRDYLATFGASLAAGLSLAREDAAAHPEAVDSALVWTLRRKAVVLGTLLRFREAQRLVAGDTAVARRAGALREARERMNRLSLSPLGKLPPTSRDSQVVALRQESDLREAEFNRHVSGRLPAGAGHEVDLQAVQRALPVGAALVELVRTQLVDFHATGPDTGQRARRYLALVLTSEPGGHAHLVDLGDADQIDRHVQDFRASLGLGYASRSIGLLAAADSGTGPAPGQKPTTDQRLGTRSRALYDHIFAPLRSALGSARMIYLSPDGELNRVPFEALVDEQGRYLIERYRFAYLTSGAELLEPKGELARGTVIFAAPDCDLGVRVRKAQSDALLVPANAASFSLTAASSPFRGARSGEVRGWQGWSALPETPKEAAEVQRELAGSVYGPVRVYQGQEALEEVFKRMPAPRVLHVATHGYFFPDQEAAGSDRADLAEGFGAEQRLARIRGTENPLLRSGLVLAGANAGGAESDSLGVDDGWLTAEEIGLMDLHGTDLVVLSACETGLGDVRLGEGVSGLRRAFRYAGARTLVMSLFPVEDRATRRLMGRFYHNLKAGRGKLEALRGAQLETMRRKGSAHPFYWASFVLVGDPN